MAWIVMVRGGGGDVLNRHQDLEWENGDKISPKLFHLLILESRAALANRIFWNNKIGL